LSASGAAAATSSIEAVPMVDSENVTPARCAARAAASSPSWCIIRVNPVGASANGSAQCRPSTVVLVSGSLTSRSA
jgi:hypothetical protein